MKKIQKIITILIIFTILLLPFSSHAETNNDQKGALRCPTQITNSNVRCTEITDSNGNVTEIDITYGSIAGGSDVEIVKKVKKTNELGHYEISFDVRGSNLGTTEVYADANVILILDMSKTVSSSINEIKTATQNFYDNLKNIDTVRLAIIQFAKNSYIRKNYDATSFTLLNYNSGGLGTTSHVEKALSQATSLLTGDRMEYIILLGDGQYWYDDDTDVAASQSRFQALRNTGVTFYMIQYAGGLEKYNEGYKKYGQYNKPFIETFIKPDKWWCNYGNYDYSTKSWCANDTVIDYNTILQEIADSIKVEVTDSVEFANGVLTDRVGSNFTFSDSYSGTKTFNVENTSGGVTVGPFYVDIDAYAEDGWHQTNSSFSFAYTTSSGESKTITCDVSPEVYWVQQKLEINSCSGVATSDTIKTGDSDEYEYYEKICYEGYLRDNQYYNGFSVGIKINNLPDGTESFDIEGGLGFPANINVSTNLMCQYKFDYEKFNEDYSELTRALNTTSDAKEIATLTKRRENMDKILNNYINLTKNDLENYIARFTDQSATLRVDYSNSQGNDVATFIDSSEVNSNLSCQNVRNQTINGKTVIVDQTCYLSLSKSMQLPTSCLDMTTGDQINCSDDNTQISGGNKFYTDLKESGGNIYVNLENAGYSGLLNVKLEDCSFIDQDSGGLNQIVKFRQIDLTDPFNQNYGTNREIGKNYSNNDYNFVNIIKSDIWDDETSFMYQYQMSKENIENIRKDTSEEGVSSYNGRNCYFNSSNKYICEFTRSGLENSSQSNLFSNVKIND